MSEIRKVKRIAKGAAAVDGAGVKLIRVIGYYDTKDFDPFLMLDAFDSTNPDDYTKGFPWHPHRGIETITYLISGEVEHGDSLGNKGTIRDGDCQWMTAGSGIIHQEMPKPAKRLLGTQLWLNLSAKDKMVSPKYGDIKKENIPIIDEAENTVRIIAGSYIGINGAFEGSYVKAVYLDVDIKPDGHWQYECAEDLNLFIYIIQGAARLDPENEIIITEKQAVLFTEGRRLWVEATGEGIRFLLFSAKSLKEPIAWGGPIVMNTKEELDLAFKELKENSFIKNADATFLL